MARLVMASGPRSSSLDRGKKHEGDYNKVLRIDTQVHFMEEFKSIKYICPD
uniref:Uncharacterized protein n=1 Tax=Arundo donax TaxID=35708 RepID=A0A0A8ZHG8_ARUDO